MGVTVFGAGNAIGREVVTDLVLRGHEVIAHLPDLTEAPDGWGGEVELMTGRLTGPPAVRPAPASTTRPCGG